MVFGLGGRDHDSQNELFLTLETPGYFKNERNPSSFLKHIMFGNLTILDIENFGKGGDRLKKIPKIHLICCENLEDGINIFQKT